MSEPSTSGNPVRVTALETSADDEAFVTALATSLVVLIARWRERADAYERSMPADASGLTYDRSLVTHQVRECASELEAVLRNAT